MEMELNARDKKTTIVFTVDFLFQTLISVICSDSTISGRHLLFSYNLIFITMT